MITYIKNGSVEQTTLSAILSKSPKTILYFYPKNDTPGCTVEATDFTALSSDFEALGIQIVGISKDSVESHCSFIDTYHLTPGYISDPTLELHKQYGARGEKNNYGKIVTGVIRSTIFLDNSGTIIKQRNNVRAKGHANKILEFTKKNT